jgi:Protein of unknown function (DUF3253)
MERTRQIAYRLVEEGSLLVLQKGNVIPLERIRRGEVKGPIRLKWCPGS